MRHLGRVFLGILLGSLLALPTFAQKEKVGGGRYDQQIQDAVTKLFNSKDKWNELRASTEDGIVTLTGSQKLLMDKLDVGNKVDNIEHVNGVRNHIEVSTTVPDQELSQKLADKLRYDRVGYGILFNNLTLEVKNGVATIGGKVHDYPSRDSAIAIARTTPGVKEVVDNIDVLPTSPMDDELRVRIARAIYGNSSLSRYAIDPEKPIRIVVDNGHVTLNGVVDSQLDKTLAEAQAKSVPGAFSVDNKLVVANGSASGSK